MVITRKKSFIVVLISFVLVCTLCAPSQAWAIVEGDQTPLSEEEIEEARANEQILTNELDVFGYSANTLSAVQGNRVKSFSGIDRFDTAALQAMYEWRSSHYAVLAGGDGWPDALAASSLAGALNCPILFTGVHDLSADTSNALASLQVKEIVIVGGEAVVGAEVEAALAGLGITVTRLSGDDRYATQLAIFEYGLTKDLWSAERLVVASGDVFADALAGAPLAAKGHYPVFLTNGAGGFSEDQVEALTRGATVGKKLFRSVLIMGGPARVVADTESFLRGVSISSAGGTGSVTRLAGSTRYDTAAVIARWSVTNMGFSYSGVAFASGQKAPDSLGGGALQGKQNSVLLLVDTDNTDAALSVLPTNGAVGSIKFFGGKATISMATRLVIATELGFSYSEVSGLRVYLDVGHGEDSSNDGRFDIGASGNGYIEYDLNCDLAHRVAYILRDQYGIETHVNDGGGWYKLRQAEAEALSCDLLVSIHFNASNGAGTGTESYIHSYNSAEGSVYLQEKIHQPLVRSLGLANRGMKEEEFAVVGGNVPAVLLEVAFIDNANDMRVYHSKIDSVAQAIAAGIAS